MVRKKPDSGSIFESQLDGFDVSRPIEGIRPDVEDTSSGSRGEESFHCLYIALAVEHLRLGNLLRRRAVAPPSFRGVPSGTAPGRPERQVEGHDCAHGGR